MNENPFTSSTFYRFLNEQKLMGTRCQTCNAIHLPPRPICNRCLSEDLVWVEMGGRGKLLAYTTVHIAPTAMLEAGYDRKNPYCAGIVQLDNGPAISAQIIGVDATQPEKIAIGSQLQIAFVQRGAGDKQQTYLAFEPVQDRQPRR